VVDESVKMNFLNIFNLWLVESDNMESTEWLTVYEMFAWKTNCKLSTLWYLDTKESIVFLGFAQF
jgi:hypothetical protein